MKSFGPLVLWLAASSALAQPGAGPCSCADREDLINRVKLAHAAIDKLRAEIPDIAAKKAAPTAPAASGPGTNKDALRDSIDAAMHDVRDSAARTGTGETFVDCKSTITAPTACLRAVLQTHEDVHRNQCNADKQRLHLGTLDDRWKAKSLVDYANEDIAGYQAELDDALKRLRALPASCRPGGWFGTITAFQVKRVVTSNFVKPGNTFSDGTTEKSSDSLSRWGTIHFSSQPTATWSAQRFSSITRTTGGRVACKGGLKTVQADHHEVNTLYSQIAGEGGHQDPPAVSLDFTVDNLYYTLAVQVPAVTVKVKESGYNDSTGGCQPFNIKVPDLPPVDSPVAALGNIELKGRMKPTDKELSGSHDEDLIPFKTTVPGIDTNTDIVRFVWHLHRVD